MGVLVEVVQLMMRINIW